MIIDPPFIDRDLAGAPVKSWRIHGSQAEHIAYMRKIVDAYRQTHALRQLAALIIFDLARLPAKARRRQALAIARWVKENIRYLNESVETFYTPIRLLRAKHGDCDDHTMLVCSLLEAAGIPSKIVAMKWGGFYRHVYPAAVVPEAAGWTVIPLDTTLRSLPGDVDPIAVARRQGRNPLILAL